ncbi:MAG: peptidylprolyl isomerase, partial [Coriobacteriia bacterium]|nr:peptidylprolyl isomerase [Coriobacteriia bacterium]
QIPNAAELPVGKTVYADTSNGPMALRVVEKNDEFAVFDMNHELAGKALNFEITLVEIIG